VPDTTIESAKYNNNVADVAADLNAPRPVVAGGTGANNATDAAINLGVVSGKTAITYTDAEKAVARTNIAAAPFDALAYNGMQINGSIDVSQERGTTPISLSGTINGYAADGWRVFVEGSQTINTGAYVSAPKGLRQAAQVICTVANAVPASTHYVMLSQQIEGYRVARLAWGTVGAVPITVGFWTAAKRNGVYSGSIRGGGGRSYPFNITVNAADTWEYKVVSIPGDTAGTWEKTNLGGLELVFCVMGGANFLGTANAWVAASRIGVVGTMNGVGVVGDYFAVTGVIVLPGTQAPTAEQSPLIMRPYDQELVICQRYWQKVTASMRYYATVSTQNNSVTYPFLAEMRAAPTITLTGAGSNSGNLSDFTLVALDARTAVLNIVGTTGDIYSNGRSWSLDARL